MADVGIKIRATDEASGVFSKVAAEAGKLQTSVASAGTSFAALGTAAVAGLSVISFATKIKDAIDMADSFNKLSQKTGVAVESLSKLNYAAGLADVSTEALSTGLKKLNVNISAAAGGSAEQAAVFKALGISVKDAAGNVLGADKIMAKLADSFAESGDGANKAAVAVALFGKAGTDLIPLLNAGSKGLSDMGDEAKKLGIVMGADFAKNAEEFNDNLHKISLAGQGLFVTLGGDLVKGLGATVKAMAEASLEGGKLAAVIAGIQTLFTGDDQYKNDKALVEQTTLMLQLEKSLGVARASGNAAYIKSREDALAAVNAEIKATMSYRKVLQGAADDKAAAEKPKPTQDSAAIKAAAASIAKRTNAPKETGNAFTAEQDAAKEWAKALEAAGKASDELVAKNLDLSKSQAALKTYMESAAAAINEKTNPAMNAMVKAAYEANIALEALGKLADVVEAQQKRTSTAEDETQKERERVAAIGLTIEAVANLNATRLEEMATAKERTLLAAQEIDLSGELSDAIKGEVKALRERAALIRTGAEKENAVEAAKAASEEWKRGWEQTDQLAREAFTAWAEDGSSAAKKIGDTLKKALLSAIYEATLKPIAFQLYTSVAGGGGAGNAALQAASGASSASSGLNILGSAGTLFGSGFKAGLGAVFGEAGTMGGLSAGTTAIGAGNLAGGFGTLAGTALPWIAGAAILKSLTDYKIDAKGNGITATVGGANGLPSGQVGAFAEFQQTGGLGGGGTTTNRSWSVADQSVATYITANVQAITAANKQYGAALGLTTDAIDGFTKNIEVNLTGLDAAGQKAAIDAELAKFSADQITATYGDALASVAKTGETTGATLERLATDLSSVNSTFDALGYTLYDVSVAGAAAASGLASAFGSLQNFQAQTQALFQNFYTADEQKANAVKNATTTLNAAGITDFSAADISNASREQIRAVVDQYAAKIGTADGDKKYAAVVTAANSISSYVATFDDKPKAPAESTGSSGGGGGGGGSSPVQDAALSAWQDATDAIVKTMGDLRTTLVDSGPDSFVKLQAQFAIESASAKAGNVAAAQDLPALAKSLVDASKTYYTTSVQQSLLTARVIDTLGSVAGTGSAGANLSIPKFASGGTHSGGWAMVGEQGPELAYMPPARIYNANDTRGMLGGGTDPALLEEVRALRAELAAIRANTGSTASSSRKTAQVLDTAANGGQPIGTKAIA